MSDTAPDIRVHIDDEPWLMRFEVEGRVVPCISITVESDARRKDETSVVVRIPRRFVRITSPDPSA